jgi:hypothetical protein
MLTAIKLLHTVIWAFLAASILVLPVAGVLCRFRWAIIQVLKAGAVYFAVVFAVGFVLGTIRTLWVVPRFGAITAELMEMPVMLAVTIVEARRTVLRLSVPMMWSARLEMGCIALVLMLVAEFGFVLWIRRPSIKGYFATRDPVLGAAYYLLLMMFAIMPLVVARR